MTTFLWVVIIAMAAALLAEILAFAGMALVVARATRRVGEITGEFKQRLEGSRRAVDELKLFITPRIETIAVDGKEMGALLATRLHMIESAVVDTRRRSDRIRLRLLEGVQSVAGNQKRRGIYRDVMEPVQTATQVLSGLKFALWLLRKVA